MVFSQRLSGRTRIIHGQGVTTVVISPEGRIVSAIFALLMLGFWTFGGLFAAALLMVALDNGESGAFMMAWLTIWVFAEVFMVVYILWKLFGRIVVTGSAAEVSVAHKVLGIGPTMRLPASSTSGMVWVPNDHSVTKKINGKRIAQSALRISATPRSVTIARGISRSDAEAVVSAIGPRMPRWGRAAA